MQKWDRRQRFKYEGELDAGFAREIMAMPGGENLNRCIQCGTCSGSCPVAMYMDYSPRKIIAMTRAGFREEVLRSSAIWMCASCYNCTVECPRQIKITDIMYALKQKAIQERCYPRWFAIPALAREFFNVVQRNGRNCEGRVIVGMYLKTNPFMLFRRTGLGWRLWWRGRLVARCDSCCKQMTPLRKLLTGVGRKERDLTRDLALASGARR
ncbi:MAG: 4Fe-4S dicluster domain-containing protein [Candidatus Hydrogenedentes bacterium]|nr:4Fe-4S dicluster domain-containing protein [Candidatus Hydrogenedentota bacterium]